MTPLETPDSILLANGDCRGRLPNVRIALASKPNGTFEQ